MRLGARVEAIDQDGGCVRQADGCEVAYGRLLLATGASASSLPIVAPDTLPLAHILGDEIGRHVRGLHEEQGVTFQLGSEVDAIGADTVTLAGGDTIKADLVVLGVGLTPRVPFAAICMDVERLRFEAELERRNLR